MRKAAPFEESLSPHGHCLYYLWRLVFTAQRNKDYIAYPRVIVNPNDEEALKRIINYGSWHWQNNDRQDDSLPMKTTFTMWGMY